MAPGTASQDAPGAAATGEQPETPAAPAAEPLEVPTISPDELTPGQKGYGLSVFAGSRPERFEAEVVGVLRNLAPDTSYILARLSGRGLEESGVAAGMSGSPVYFDGRLAGAVAFSWPFSHDAIAGITPIGSMRRIPVAPGVPPGGVPVQPAAAAAGALGPGAVGGPPVPLAELAAGRVPADLVERELERLRPRLAGGATAGIQWSLAGFPAATEDRLRRWLGPVAPAGAMADEAAAAGLAPGGSVSAVLVDGDLRLAATGTVTDVAGDSVLAFGHAFLGVGPIRVPMASSEVVTVLSSVMSSFKVANLGPVVGAFEEDRVTGIRGRVGAEAPMVPLTLTVRAPEPRQLHMRLASMPQITPVLIAISSMAGLDAASYANGIQGLDMTVHFRLAGLDDLIVEQSFDGPGAAAQASAYLMGFAGYLLQNDLAEVGLDAVEVELVQSPAPRTATLVGAHAERTVVRPGESIDLNLDFVAWRGAPFRRTVTVDLPDDLPDGRYYLFVGDGPSADAARLAVEPPRPVKIGQALGVLRSLHSQRELVVLGMVEGPGLAVAGEVMPKLPGSVRSIWSQAGSGSAVPLRLAVAQQRVEPLDQPIEGLARIDLRVRRREPVTGDEGGAGEGAGEDGEPGGGEAGEAEPAPEGDQGGGGGQPPLPDDSGGSAARSAGGAW